MIKLLSFLFILFVFTGVTSIYTITIPGSGNDSTITISAFQGKKILIVNTASGSNYTTQYTSLEQLYQQYKDSLVIIAVPSNSFGNEPDDDSTIAAAVNAAYHISYLLAAKSEVTGAAATDLYSWLESEDQNGVMNSITRGDFQKYLIDGSGNLIGVFAPSVDPMSSELKNAIIGE